MNKYASTYFRLIEKALAEGRSGYVECHHSQARVAAQTGKKVSDETRKKMSVALKGKPQPESVKVAQRALKTGVPLSEAHRQSVSKGLTGTKRGPYSEEHKEAIRNGLLGLERGAMTEEHKAKISKANSKPKSEATKEKMRLAWEVRRQKIKEPVCV